MMRLVTVGLVSGFCVMGVCADTSVWSEFRGSAKDGTSAATGLPLTWNETENIVWKTEIPGIGHSSPVAAGGRIWFTQSPDGGRTRHVMCVDFETGKIIRNIPLFTWDPESEQKYHDMNSHATPTPVVEGNRVYVTFGNPGTACLNAETGETIWTRTDIINRYFDVGPASCPTLYGNKLIIQCDGQPSAARFVIALDKDTGKTLWRTDRRYPNDEVPGYTHASCMPLAVTVNGRQQLVSPGANGVRGYDLETGEELWVARYKAWSVVPRPVSDGNLVFICAGVVNPIMLAIRLDKAKGDITDSDAIVWSTTKRVPDMPSPLLINNRFYTLLAAGKFSCLDPATGDEIWSENLPKQHLASPISTEGRIYLFNTEGTATVVALGDTFRLLASNKLDTGCHATPAIVGKSLIVRTSSHLYRIEDMKR
ncbi:MAG: PQQ-like beta-propeller repeat protein [Kiritimatiellaeota bacterium]|nr:PQQ-like beta-propeller repeat protein [Kiritimatiellota bacterium]